MSTKKVSRLYLLLFLLTGSLVSCNVLPTVTYNGTPVLSSTTTSSSSNGPTLNVWTKTANGVEVRYEDWKSPGTDEDTVTIVRFDLHRVHLQVGYQPTKPMGMSDWMRQEHALAIINGGYFDQQNNSTALVVSNGQAAGTSYNGFGGMLAVNAQGNVQLRSLRDAPYDPNNEQLQQATQSSPMLMIGGKRTTFTADSASQRRSIVAMDKQGRMLFIVSPSSAFSLDEMADLLAASDLSLQTALNLDGGASTGLYVNAGKPDQHVTIDPIAALPIVIIVK